jgi:hypothetical protein
MPAHNDIVAGTIGSNSGMAGSNKPVCSKATSSGRRIGRTLAPSFSKDATDAENACNTCDEALHRVLIGRTCVVLRPLISKG